MISKLKIKRNTKIMDDSEEMESENSNEPSDLQNKIGGKGHSSIISPTDNTLPRITSEQSAFGDML
jgi:hypothetical protein